MKKEPLIHKPISTIILGPTSHWIAAARALESAREDCLFDDPWAALLAGAKGTARLANRSPDSLAPRVLRIRFFDDLLKRITRENAIQQVVLMAAGLDTRSFQLPWPYGTSLFELVPPLILQEKEQILNSVNAQPTCARHVIKVDLTFPWKKPLCLVGFDPERHSVWLLESFLFNIPNGSITQILSEVNDLPSPGS